MKSIQIKVNKAIPPYVQDQVVTVQVDEFNIPVKKFWRDRLQDAVTDACVEIVKDKQKTQTKKDSPKEES